MKREAAGARHQIAKPPQLRRKSANSCTFVTEKGRSLHLPTRQVLFSRYGTPTECRGMKAAYLAQRPLSISFWRASARATLSAPLRPSPSLVCQCLHRETMSGAISVETFSASTVHVYSHDFSSVFTNGALVVPQLPVFTLRAVVFDDQPFEGLE